MYIDLQLQCLGKSKIKRKRLQSSLGRGNLGMLLVLQHDTVSGVAPVERLDSIIDLCQRPVVDPGFDALLVGELDHLTDFLGGSNQTASNLDALSNQRKLKTVSLDQLVWIRVHLRRSTEAAHPQALRPG